MTAVKHDRCPPVFYARVVVVGVAESLCATFVGFIGTDLKVGVPFALMAVILLARPQGLFGR